MTSSHLEDLPPPPYSETDIFSASGRDAHLADDASRSTSSTNGEVIYTPPLTPRSAHQSNFAGEVDHVLGSAAAAYFETRPASSSLNSQPHITHSLTLTANSTPDALPYPRNLATRDIRLEDWQTFVNYLIPHHSATSNEQVIDRKLRAEAMTATVTTHTAAANDDARSQSSGRSHAEAQLNRIRTPAMDTDAAQQRENVGTTVREWNDGFFVPRRVTIHVDLEPTAPNNNNNNNNNNTSNTSSKSSKSNLNEVPPQPDQQQPPHMPGAWDQSFDQPDPASADRNTPGGGRRGFGLFSHFAGRGGRGGGHHGDRGAAGGGFRFAGINVENDRVSIGNTFVADGRTGSVRIGGIVADGNGISINGQPMFGGAGLPGRGRGGLLPGRGRCGTGPPGWGAGGGPGGWGSWGGHHGRGAWGRGGGGPWGRGGWWGGDRSSAPEDAGEQGRGRGEHRGPGHRHGRSRSSSASSVSSRSSSVRSDSSAGSLPDYDDLKDSQLPVARQVLQDSLHHPDRPITKERVKEIRAQLKAAKQSADPASMAFDKAALRHEVKELLRNWKSLKKEQKRTRKQLRRDLKQRRRQEKRERRQVKRELKNAAKQMKREFRRGPWGHSHHHPPHHPHAPHAPHAHHPPHSHHMPPMPPMPSMPAMPAMPHMPPMPHGGIPPPPGYDSPWNTRAAGGEGDDAATSRTPGAWPSDDKHQHHENQHDEGVAAYPVSQSKYQAAWEMEAKVAEKEAELLALHERLVEDEHHGNGGGGGNGKGNGGGGLSKMEAEAVAVEREIEELARELERLRTDADEEFARELEKEDERAYRG